MEVQLDTVKPYVNSALTFEELQALFDSRDIDLTTLEEGVLDNVSYLGRIFARCGGCIGGAGCLTHGAKNKMQVDKYRQEAMEKTILDAI